MYPCILFCSSSGCFIFFYVCFLSLLLLFCCFVVVVFVWFWFYWFWFCVFIPSFLFLLLFLLLSWCLGFVIIITLLSRCTPWRNEELTGLHITNKSETTITATCTLQTAQRKNNPIWYNWQVCVYIQQHPCIHSPTLIHFQNMLTEILIQSSFTLSANIHWVVAVFCLGLLLLLFYCCFVSVLGGNYPDCIFSVSKPILLVIVSVGAVICSFRSMFYNRSFLTQNDLATGNQSKLHDLLFEWFWLIETALWGYCYYYCYYKQSKLTSCSSGQDFNWLKLCFKVIVVIIIITNSWSWPVRVDRIMTNWNCALQLIFIFYYHYFYERSKPTCLSGPDFD